ncbi:sulfurtransferase [Maricaulis sp.]|uniref:sulfurtransferase n=1 Tax=Maricaulis sp. TaxID=1486257 RepID=UPI002B270AA8|nr:rhodanese-like domain-containing protein [Maricaulis sp.]
MANALVSAVDALARLGAPDTVFVDGSWTFPGGPRDGAEGCIPGSRHFDIDQVRDTANPLPHMLPDADTFTRHVRALGINTGSRLIIYDRFGLFSAARVWWMFKTMGHDDTQVLDGGLPAWIAAGGAIASNHASDDGPGDFVAAFRPDLVVDLAGVETAIRDGSALILDARGKARFTARVAEPREGMRSGHMPGARNLPFTELLDANGLLRLDPTLFERAGVEPGRPVITTCGSGVTACILSLALDCLGRESTVYDGSWTEWGSRPDTEIETGRAPS